MRHVGSYRSALVQYLAYGLSRDAKQTRKLVLRQFRCRQNIFTQNLAGMSWSSLSIVQIIFKVYRVESALRAVIFANTLIT
jgi:hypothetical protein